MRRVVWRASVLLGVLACGSAGSVTASRDAGVQRGDAGEPRSSDASKDATKPADAGAPRDAASRPDGGAGCHATAGAANRTRKVVVSHPYDDAQNAAGAFEVWDLDETGHLTEPGVSFALGPTSQGTIAFTPDGEVGLVAEDDGSLGVFTLDASGAVTVVAASLTGSYYATGVVMDPSGRRAYVLDQQTLDNGGGVYTVSIACDGTVKDEGLLAPAALVAGVLPVPGGNAVLVAKNLAGVPAIFDAGGADVAAPSVDGGPLPGNDALLVPWPRATPLLGTADPFGDDLDLVSAATLTEDSRFVLIGDNSQFSGIPNRVGVVEVSASTLSPAGVVENVNDPECLVASPFDDTVLVTSALGNALFVLSHADAGFSLRGALSYAGPEPQLPGPAVMVATGSLTGRVLVAENQAIRQVQFAAGGVVTDLGPTPSGDAGAFTSIVGAIGVQP